MIQLECIINFIVCLKRLGNSDHSLSQPKVTNQIITFCIKHGFDCQFSLFIDIKIKLINYIESIGWL